MVIIWSTEASDWVSTSLLADKDVGKFIFIDLNLWSSGDTLANNNPIKFEATIQAKLKNCLCFINPWMGNNKCDFVLENTAPPLGIKHQITQRASPCYLHVCSSVHMRVMSDRRTTTSVRFRWKSNRSTTKGEKTLPWFTHANQLLDAFFSYQHTEPTSKIRNVGKQLASLLTTSWGPLCFLYSVEWKIDRGFHNVATSIILSCSPGDVWSVCFFCSLLLLFESDEVKFAFMFRPM